MKKSERKNHINYWRQSGQTKKAYSELAGIKYATFISWFKKSEEEQIGRFVKLEKTKQSSGEAAATTQQVEETEEVVVRKKKKTSRKKPQRNRFPESLERETTILQPTGIDLEGFTQIGTDVTELLSYRPASLYVKQIIRPRLVDKKNEDKGVLQAPIPPRIVPKGMVDESLIAEIIKGKSTR